MRDPLIRLARVCLGALLAASAASGQVVFDGSLGPDGEAESNGAGIDFVIDQSHGQPRGRNLFHSFSEFSVPEGMRAEFTAVDYFDTVVARVTGDKPSCIAGTLASSVRASQDAGADLFFLNPKGVFFKETAQLDVPASFHVASADSLHFADGAELVVRELDHPVLSSFPPAAFGFLPGPAGEIEFDKPLPIRVVPGATLSAVGGDVSVLRTGTVLAPRGTIQLAAVGEAEAQVPLDVASFEARGVADLGYVKIDDNVTVEAIDLNATDAPQGRVVIRGGALSVVRSFVYAGGDGTLDDTAVDVEVAGAARIERGSGLLAFGSGAGFTGGLRLAADEVAVNDHSVVGIQTYGSGDAGTVRVEADRLVVSDVSDLASESFGTGAGGALDVVDADRVTVTRLSEIATRSSNGPGGALSIGTRDLTASAGGQISTTTNGSGAAGALSVVATGDVLLTGEDAGSSLPSGIFARSGTELGASATGAGGSLTLSAANLEVANGALISSRTFGSGNAGDLKISATETVRVAGGADGSGLISAGGLGGKGGSIAVDAPAIEVVAGGQILASTAGEGLSGNIVLGGEGGTLSVTVSGRSPRGARSAVTAETTLLAGKGDGGDAGRIEVRADHILLADGALVSTGSAGSGAPNDIDIAAVYSLRIDDAEVRSLAQAPTTAVAGGDIGLSSGGDLGLANGALVNAQALGAGDAGSIAIEAGGALDLERAGVTTEARQALGGNIALRGGERVTLTRSQVTTSVQQGDGTGGDIDLGPRRVSVNRSLLLAKAFEGEGGNIRVRASAAYLESSDSDVDASSAFGVDGTVVVTAPDSDLAGELASLPETFLDPSQLLRRECALRTRRAGSFVVRGAAPSPAPDAALSAGAPDADDAEGCPAP